MFVQNFIELCAAFRELSCWQREKNSSENNTVFAFAGSNNDSQIGGRLQPVCTVCDLWSRPNSGLCCAVRRHWLLVRTTSWQSRLIGRLYTVFTLTALSVVMLITVNVFTQVRTCPVSLESWSCIVLHIAFDCLKCPLNLVFLHLHLFVTRSFNCFISSFLVLLGVHVDFYIVYVALNLTFIDWSIKCIN